MENREQVESPPAAGADYAGQAAEQLWQRWRQKQGPTLQEVLAHAGELTAAQLALALGAEQHQNWQEGKRTPAEAYLQQYPVLSADEEAACDLVYGEFLLRQELGEAPSLQEYLERFPQLADGLKQLHEYAQFNSVLHWLPLDSTADVGERPDPTPPNLPDYELLKWIGAGTFGQVWLARNRHDGGLCAVKIVAKSHQSELDGVRLYRQCAGDHPSLVAIKHVGEGEGFYYYVMPLADDVREGTLSQAPEQYEPMTLRRHLAGRQRLPADEVVAIARQLLSALAQLHKRGVSHCDVKPDNVLRVRGNWQLGDMGLATPSALMGAERGTLAYFPPEGPHDQTADLYALGKTLYLLLTGAGLERFTEFADGTLEIPGRDPRSGRLRQIILRACHPDPGQRFPSAAAMLRALDEAVGGRKRKYRLLAGTFVLVILVGGGLFVLGKMLWPDAGPPGFTVDEGVRFTNLGLLARQLKNEGKFAEAVRVQEEMAELAIYALGKTHFQTLSTQQDLETSRRMSRLPPKAQDELGKVFRRMENIPSLAGQGQLKEAIADQRSALDGLQKYIREDDLTLARTMLYLGFLLLKSRDYDESEGWSTKSREMLLRLWAGEETLDSSTALSNVAGCYFAREDYVLAEQKYRRVREIREKMHPGVELTILSRINLAKTLRKLGKDQEANNEIRKAGSECQKLSLDNPLTASICIPMAEDHEGQKQPGEAQAYLERALKAIRSQKAEDGLTAAEVHLRLATNLGAQGMHKEAELEKDEAATIVAKIVAWHVTVATLEPSTAGLTRCALELDRNSRARAR
jgi:tetratricopeptide (TPR) repeat protein